MDISRLAPDFTDDRGTITDIASGVEVQHVAIITSNAGAVRGNHYHVESTQYEYLVSGRCELVTQVEGAESETRMMEAGDLAVSEPGVRHAMRFLEPSVLLVLGTLPRDSAAYEADTVRLEKPLIAP